MKHIKIIISSVICCVCIVAFCFVAITGKIYKLEELPLNFMSTFLGAMVTAILMLMLLRGQSNAEEIKERNVLVFDKKSKIYNKFMRQLYKVLQERKINGNTYRKINSEFYTKLVLYLKKKSQRKITVHLAKLVECIGIEMNDGIVTYSFLSPGAFTVLNDNYSKLIENIFSINNILIYDLGLGGNMDVNMQNELEKNTFPYLLIQTLLEEIDNLFIKKDGALFKKAYYDELIGEPFIIIPIKGKINPGGKIQIGPFSNNSQVSSQKRLLFRLLVPESNPRTESYTSSRESNNEKKYIVFSGYINEYVENDKIDLSFFQNPDLKELEKIDVEKEYINNNLFIYQFGFDSDAYTLYYGFYVSICKTIAARAYISFLTARTAEGYKLIKELCEEFGEATNEEITDYIAKKQGLNFDD